MKREYFKRFYFVFIAWIFAMAGMKFGERNLISEVYQTAYWIGFVISLGLGIYLAYRLARFVIGKLPITGNDVSDTMVQVSLIAGFAGLVLISLLMNWLSPVAMLTAPFYSLWNLYRYLTFDHANLN